jgi:CheY-like chemotaxis protein
MRTGAQGTTLSLSLPPLKGEAPVVAAAVTPEGTPSEWAADMPPRNVLVVDDDEFTRLVTRRLLPSPPFRVTTAANGEAAIELMAQQGWPDYLLLDMEMPLRSGVDTVTWVREQEAAQGHGRCRVLMVSGNDDEASVQRALDAGADRFLVKPVSRERLLTTLREMEEAGRVLGDTRPPPSAPSASPMDDDAPPDDIVVVDAEWEEVLPDVMRMQRETVDRLAQAVAAGDRKDVQFLAHRVYGGLATLGLQWAAHESRTLERTAEHAPMAELEGRVRALRAYLHRVKLQTR